MRLFALIVPLPSGVLSLPCQLKAQDKGLLDFPPRVEFEKTEEPPSLPLVELKEAEDKDKLFIGLCCGQCGGNMPLNIPGGGIPVTKEFRVKFGTRFMHMDGLQDGTDEVGVGESLDDWMMVPTKMDMWMGHVALGYSFTDDFFLGAMFMYMKKDMDMRNRAGERTDMVSEGPADTMLLTKYRFFADDPFIPEHEVSALVGLSVPTGSINERDNGSLLPYSMQLGTGTVDPIVGVLYEGSHAPWWWGADLLFTKRVYKNARDYKFGDELRFDLYAMYQPRYDLVAELQINNRWWGEIYGQADNAEEGTGHIMNNPAKPFATPLWDPDQYGGHQMNLTMGVQWQPWEKHIINLQGGFPIYQDLGGLQMDEKFELAVTWYIEIPTPASRRFR